MKTPILVALIFSLAASAALAQTVPPAISAAVADRGRPDKDVARDATRKPAETMAFVGIAPGMTVAELLPGDGYFTRMISKAVGSAGHVTTIPWNEFQTGMTENLALNGYANITVFRENMLGFKPNPQIDVFFTTQNYHDITPVQRGQVNQVIFKALKPGGVYFILDHAAKIHAGYSAERLHRIDEDIVKTEVERAGFVLAGESDILRNPADDRSLLVFNPAIRGNTDQFLLKFVKPLIKPVPRPAEAKPAG
jgi:predicted methyltransferase